MQFALYLSVMVLGTNSCHYVEIFDFLKMSIIGLDLNDVFVIKN